MYIYILNNILKIYSVLVIYDIHNNINTILSLIISTYTNQYTFSFLDHKKIIYLSFLQDSLIIALFQS